MHRRKMTYFPLAAAVATAAAATPLLGQQQKGTPPTSDDAAGFVAAQFPKTCIDCHSVQQGNRRPVIDEFGLASHHLSTDPLRIKDCVVCHDLSAHREGNVRLNNVDTGQVYMLTGDPMTNPAEAAKLEPFCLACHDGNGANGQPPFSDNNMPWEIDATLWVQSSHYAGGSAGPMTCFGDGETFGCHSSGHGSIKRQHLAPFDGGQPPVQGDPLREEEGMCYTCHDADGPSIYDQESSFGMNSHHNVSLIDQQADGSKVECLNCHNPHAANSANRIADPDSGGWTPWGGTKEAFCLTCHDGDPPANVAYPATANGTGYDKSSFVGATHDTEMGGGSSCIHCHSQHGSDQDSLLHSRYNTIDNMRYYVGDGKYAQCWQCHDENATTQSTNAFGSRHRLHMDDNVPCIMCHDTHAPRDVAESGLINFDFAVFSPNHDASYYNGYDGSNSFWFSGNSGNCYILCHGKSHTSKSYSRSPNPMVDCTPCH
ncbi:MAG: hypothetical protein D8M59_15645 [Planctomycetes bacterium]|nr:hypothetical protein [Planctomycetota bacterium]NOG54908.1 hypothetical protein [Planctomycetota bacterium]